MKIIVDADACPKGVLNICFELGQKYSIQVWTIASFNHNIQSDHHIIVGCDDQEADLKIINISEEGDIAVTQDWGLAAMLLGKHLRSSNPSGKEYSPETIEFLLEKREAKAKYRPRWWTDKRPKETH